MPYPKLNFRFKRQQRFLIQLFLLIVFICSDRNGYAQLRDTLSTGELRGIVRDSAFNFVMNSATVAVYTDRDSALLQYTLPNNFGEFSVKRLPLDVPLRLVVTHVGYRTLLKRIAIPSAEPVLSLGNVNMRQLSEDDSANLEEVVVKAVVPMRMNGDTLEFNADAFRLDSNATAEDLLRRLPGFTIWGDGDITFNGKKINSILVNGKPFFGGDFSVATQNLPKNALDKVQVFQQVNENNPLDSTLHANLKLKETKSTGYFGKLSAGYGTDRRYAGDAMLGTFTPKLQLSVVGAFNNVNKTAGDARILIQESNYKGTGAGIAYQPDFSRPGLNKAVSAGATFQYDLFKGINSFHTKRMSGDFFFTRNDHLRESNTVTNRALAENIFLSEASNNSQKSISSRQKLSVRYDEMDQKGTWNMNTGYTWDTNNGSNVSDTRIERTGDGPLSTNTVIDDRRSVSRNVFLNVMRQRNDFRNYLNGSRIPKSFNLNYNLSFQDNTGSNNRVSSFRSFTDPAQDTTFSRFYEKQDARLLNNELSFTYSGLKRMIFGNANLAGINMNVTGQVRLHNNKYSDRVLDLNNTTDKYEVNNYLTNDRNLDITELLPAFRLSKQFGKQLSNRYNKYVSIETGMQFQHYGMKHTATRKEQEFNNYFKNRLPSASVSYFNDQYGKFNTNIGLHYNTSTGFPQVNQVAPLIDSSNALFVPMGNRALKAEYSEDLSFSWSLSTVKPRRPIRVYLNASIGKTRDEIADSTFFDNSGKRTVYYVNLDGYRFFNANTGAKKSIEWKSNTLRLEWAGWARMDKSPGFVNGNNNISRNSFLKNTFNLEYAYKGMVQVALAQTHQRNRSEQQGFNETTFTNKLISTMLSGSLLLPKNMNWSSNISFNRNTANSGDAVDFAIWNASVAYRFLEGARGEVKFSALDLLRQNISIINTNTGNSQVFGYTNVLQQYFMLTFSYYPRKFGR